GGLKLRGRRLVPGVPLLDQRAEYPYPLASRRRLDRAPEQVERDQSLPQGLVDDLLHTFLSDTGAQVEQGPCRIGDGDAAPGRHEVRGHGAAVDPEANTELVLLGGRDLERSLIEAVEPPERRRGPMGGHGTVPRPEARSHERLQPGARGTGKSIDVGKRLLQHTLAQESPDGMCADAGPQELTTNDETLLLPGHTLPIHNTTLQTS